MDGMIWTGAAIAVIGLLGIIWSAVKVVGIRRAKLSDEEARAQMNKVLPLNLGALFVATIGLMVVIVGIILS